MRSYSTHSASVKSVRISPDQKWVATGGFAQEAKLFDFTSGAEIATFTEPMRIEAIAFTGDSQYLISGGHQHALTFYRLSDLEKATEYQTPRCEYIDISMDGRLMLTAHEDSGLVGLHMFLSDLQHKQGLYHRTADAQLNNRDLKKND